MSTPAASSAPRGALRERGLDGILLFAPESHYFLCGYDTFGFAMLQCLILRADGDLQLFTRAPDLRQAQQTSTLEDDRIHIWVDREGVDPAEQLMTLMDSLGLSGRRLGVETRTVGLTAYNWRALETALASHVTLVEASDVVSLLRRHKSEDEIQYHRKAAELADDALDAALASTTAGAFEGDILAAMQGAVFSRRRRLRGQRVHHRFRAGGAAVPLPIRPPTLIRAGSTDPRVGRRLSPLPRGDDAHRDHRPAPRTSRSACTRQRWKLCWPARRPFDPAHPWAMCSMPTPESSTTTASPTHA